MDVKFEVDSIHSFRAYYDWHAKGVGFGQLSFEWDHERNMLIVDSEMMGPVSTKELLRALFDKMLSAEIETDRMRYEARVAKEREDEKYQNGSEEASL